MPPLPGLADGSRERVSTMTKRLMASLVSAVALMSLPGCILMQDKTLGESLDEATSGASIKTQLMGGGIQKFGEVDVEVADHFVLLSGRVPTEADKAEAEKIAWSVKSVNEVANELIVGNRDINRDMNDFGITQQVRSRLLDHHEGGVARRVHRFERIHLDGDAQH